jgi:hypothetical protein
VFVSIEGLGTNLVGAYGNSVCPTPSMDKLSSQSVVLDQLWADSTSPSEVLLSWWTGQHRLQQNQPIAGYCRWREVLARSLLVTDCPTVAEQEMEVFDRILLVEEESDDTQKRRLANGRTMWRSILFSGSTRRGCRDDGMHLMSTAW